MLTNSITRRLALATLSSLLWALAMPPYGLWPLGWIALVPLLLALPGTTAKTAALIGGFAGTIANYLCFYWVLELIQKFSNLGVFAYLCMLVMAMYQAIPWLLWCGILRFIAIEARTGALQMLAFTLSATSWVALEFFYPIVFPYYLANTQYKFPWTSSLVELGGVSLLSLVMVIVNISLARLLCAASLADSPSLWPQALMKGSKGTYLGIVLGLWGLTFGWHFVARTRVETAMARASKLSVGIVQPNEWIGKANALEGLFNYQHMTYELSQQCLAANEPLDLVLWPESAVRTPHPVIQRLPAEGRQPLTVLTEPKARFPLDTSYVMPSSQGPAAFFAMEDEFTLDERLAVQRGYDTPILFGTTLEDLSPGALGPFQGRPPLYNCAVLVDNDGSVRGAVEKVKLLMFGEMVPGASLFPQIYNLLPSSSALLAGSEPKVINFRDYRLGIMICYEDLLPWFHYELSTKKPQILLNLTNDAWFGKTVEPYSHMALATFRAIEARSYLIRSTPSGVSCVIDPFGQVVAFIPSDQAGTLRQDVALLDIDTGFKHWGNLVSWLCLFYFLISALWWFKNRSS